MRIQNKYTLFKDQINLIIVAFDKLNDKVESDKQKISAIRQVYPKKIMKEKNRSVQ